MPGRFSFPIEQARPSYAALPTSPLNGLAERDLDLWLLALDDLSPVRGRQDLGLAVVGDDFQHAVVLDLVPARCPRTRNQRHRRPLTRPARSRTRARSLNQRRAKKPSVSARRSVTTATNSPSPRSGAASSG